MDVKKENIKEKEDKKEEEIVREDENFNEEEVLEESWSVSSEVLGELKYEWIEEEEVAYVVRVHSNFHIKTSIEQVKASLDRLLEDNDKPDIMKWLEASNELEIFCEAAAQAGRDVIEFDIKATEILDVVWEILEDNENRNEDGGDDEDDDDSREEEFSVENDENGPEYYQNRL